MTFQRPILWIHEEALGANNPALQAWPEAPAVFVFDTRCLLYTSPSPRDS